MPTSRLWAYAKMMPRLEAEQSLARITEMAAGFGAMEEAEQQRFIQQLRQAANGGRRERPSADAAGAMLATLGIPVETIERQEGGEDLSPSNSDTPSSSLTPT